MGEKRGGNKRKTKPKNNEIDEKNCKETEVAMRERRHKNSGVKSEEGRGEKNKITIFKFTREKEKNKEPKGNKREKVTQQRGGGGWKEER